MSKHTPGPWQWEKRGGAFRAIEGPSGLSVAVTEEYAGDAWIDVSEANASLIAAAPELLAELEMLSNVVEGCGMATMPEVECRLVFARATIAKATGK